MKFLRAIFGGSKKLTTALLGIAAVLLREVLGLDPETVDAIIKLLMSYIVGQSGVDVALALRERKTDD